jgi:ABC-type branched-subunit amino acid transport system ATPase component/branched-subunit amino acid ABC-type transport system permease component
VLASLARHAVRKARLKESTFTMEILRFVLLGLAIGSLYGVAAQGIVVIFRSSGVVNFAQGAFIMTGGYTYFELRSQLNWPAVPALLTTLAVGALIGFLVHYLLMGPMRNTSPLARVVATLGILELIQSIAVLRYGENIDTVPSILPTSIIRIGGLTLTEGNVYIFGIGIVITAALWLIYKYTRFGRLTTAVSENEQAVASVGHSPDAVAAVNWAVGAMLASGTGVLIAPITLLEPAQTSQLILPALAAALLGGFGSFPLALMAGWVVGITESVMTDEVAAHNWWSGWPDSLPFLIVIAYLVARGRNIPLRSHVFDRLPKLGTGHIRPAVVLVLAAISLVLIYTLPFNWTQAFTVTLGIAVVCLSVVVVTGYAGQLSLAQYVIGATGAFVAVKIMDDTGVPFALAVVIGVLSAMVIGALLGMPALRTRGVNLAVVTLGVAIALFSLVLTNSSFAGSLDGIPVKPASIFGIDLNPTTHPDSYAVASLVVLALVALMISNLRRGVAGRRLLAVRSNERAALSLGISVYVAKLYAFVVAAGVATIGVCIIAFINVTVVFSQFDPITSISYLTSTVVGGIGMIGGGLAGALLVPSGISTRFLDGINSTLSTWLPFIGAVTVLFVLRSGGDGLIEQNKQMAVALARKLRRRSRATVLPVHGPAAVDQTAVASGVAVARPARGPSLHADVPRHGAESAELAPRPKALTIRHLSVRFGGVHAVSDMTLTVRPGTVHGLIGPNGAGKTTLIDAVTGFVRASVGTVDLNGVDIGRLGARKRANLGIARTFQSGELFTDLTVRENLALGGDDGALRRYVTDLIWPGKVRLSDHAIAVSSVFGLEPDYDLKPDALPFGRRRLVAIARAAASSPSVLLLDEPASGLDDNEAAELGEVIRTLVQRWGIGVLLVEHNLDMVFDVCDEITVMAEGRELLPASPTSVVRSSREVITAYQGESEDGSFEVAEVE